MAEEEDRLVALQGHFLEALLLLRRERKVCIYVRAHTYICFFLKYTNTQTNTKQGCDALLALLHPLCEREADRSAGEQAPSVRKKGRSDAYTMKVRERGIYI